MKLWRLTIGMFMFLLAIRGATALDACNYTMAVFPFDGLTSNGGIVRAIPPSRDALLTGSGVSGHSGVINRSFLFDSTSEVVTASSNWSEIAISKPFSIVVWVNTTKAQDTIMSKISSFPFEGFQYFRAFNNGLYTQGFQLYGSSGGHDYCGTYGSTNINDGKFHMLTVSYDGSGSNTGINMWVDNITDPEYYVGTACGEDTYFQNNINLTIGNGVFGNQLNGKMDLPTIFNKSLDQSDIQFMYDLVLKRDSYCLKQCVEDWIEIEVNLTSCFTGYHLVQDIFADQSNCGTSAYLPAENGTIYNESCTFCFENWEPHFSNSSCFINGTSYSQKTYADESNCNTTFFVPVDNGSITVNSCDYCMEDITSYYTSFGACQLPAKLQSRTRYFIDLNYADCCAMTSQPLDCHINNGSYVNTTSTQSCDAHYTTGDIAPITTDVIGSAGVNFKLWVPLLIAGIVISIIAAASIVAYSKIKKY